MARTGPTCAEILLLKMELLAARWLRHFLILFPRDSLLTSGGVDYWRQSETGEVDTH